MAKRAKREDPNQLAWDLWDLPGEPVASSAIGEPEPVVEVSSQVEVEVEQAELVPVRDTDGGIRWQVVPVVLDRPLAASEPAVEPARVPADVSPGGGGASENARGRRVRPSTTAAVSRVAGGERVERALAAARVLQELRATGRAASETERATLALWPGWGATPQVFDEQSTKFAEARAELREMWTEAEWNAAARTTVNAHYTDPAYVDAMWELMEDLGVRGGRVLEPGSGSGNFLGAAPDGVSMVGVELDPVTAEISQHLYPEAEIRAESFADTGPDGDGFDAVIGNVPFARVTLRDRAYNRDRFTMHNHFIAKSVALTKPGGLVAVLTSRYTMDSKSSAVRERIFESADLVGAVRLPARAHMATAGTEVVTDMLVFRKRVYGEIPGDAGWLRSSEVEFDGGRVPLNDYFAQRPDKVLGEISVGLGMYGQNELSVAAHPGNVGGQFAAATKQLSAEAVAAGMVWSGLGQRLDYRATEPRIDSDAAMVIGHLTFEEGEVWAEGLLGRAQVEAPVAVKSEIVKLIELRDHAVALLEAEGPALATDEALAEMRAQLGTRYDAYRDEFGPLNRVQLIPRKARAGVSDDAEEQVRRKYPAAILAFRQDPHAATLLALEVFDEESQQAKKADIFSRRVVGVTAPTPDIESTRDALMVVLDRSGTVDMEEIAALSGIETAAAELELLNEGLVFAAPVAGGDPRLVHRAEYLSGNVRIKLKEAADAAESDQRFVGNVEALTAVLPEPFGPGEITVRMGATWVPNAFYESFLVDTLGVAKASVERPGQDKWVIKMGKARDHLAAKMTTPDMSVQTFLGRVMNHGKLQIERDDQEGNKYVDQDATELLRSKADALDDDFQNWLWSDAERAELAGTIYNERFNGTVLRSYDDAVLTLPGKAEGFSPRPHQIAAVARMVAEPSAGLFHEVGAGKTAEMVMGVMELRRLGLVAKPIIVVPNNILDQFTREFKQIYPMAKVLSAGSADVAKLAGKDARKVFIARAKTGDWDSIVMTRSAFSRIGLSSETEQEFLHQKIDEERLRLVSLESTASGASRVKGQQKALIALEEKLKEAMEMERDPGLTFEQTGIDYLCIDEAHGYKNLAVASSYEGLSKPIGSKLAMDLDMKLRYLRNLGKERVVTLATATPMANGLQEMFVMQSYLRPDLLEQAGVSNPDEWARQFTEETHQVEIGPAGDYRMKTRIGKFRNLPELLTMFHVAGDVKTAKDLNLPTPPLVERPDGRRAPEIVVVPQTERSLEFKKAIADRAVAISQRAVEPSEDNMLSLSNDARSAALDMRLHDPDWKPGEKDTTKAEMVAQRVMAIHREHEHKSYTDGLGEVHPTQGGLQLVFSDRGTPKKADAEGVKPFSVYDELKRALVAQGMPASRVRFIHEAETDAEKDALFAACRAGAISVLVGSTEKMGTGTNIQARATALHHMDCPWRPSDVVQREGRLIRQGNQNAEVRIVRYVQEGSFDAFMWQTVTRKAVAAEQIMSGEITGREIEMVSDEVFSFAETMAMSNDDPRIIERIDLDSQIQKLRRLERGFKREKVALDGRVRDHEYQIVKAEGAIPRIELVLRDAFDTRGDLFSGRIADGNYAGYQSEIRTRAEFGEKLRDLLAPALRKLPEKSPNPLPIWQKSIEIGGVGFLPRHYRHTITGTHMIEFELHKPNHMHLTTEDIVRMPVSEFRETAAHSLTQRLENKSLALSAHREALIEQIEESREQVQLLTEQVRQPFTGSAELEDLVERRAKLITEMTQKPSDAVASAPGHNPPHAVQAPGADTGTRPSR